MRSLKWTLGIMFIFSLVLPLGFVPSAQAVPTATLYLSDGTIPGTVTILDGTALDSNPLPGVVTFVGTLGVFNLNVTTGATKPTLPLVEMDLNSINNASAAGILTIKFSDTGYNLPMNGAVFNAGGTLPTGASAIFDAYYDNGNVLFGTAGAIGAGLVFGPGPIAFSGSETATFVTTNPYSLTQVAKLTFRRAGNASFNADLKLVPEPSILLLLGSGLVATRFLRGRRKKA